jgi:hypothetical protein
MVVAPAMSRHTCLAVGGLAAVLALAAAPAARAGCPNVCELTIDAVSVVPSLDCAHWQLTPNTCDCGVFVEMANGCSAPLDAVGFAFSSCGAPGASASSLTQPCLAVSPTQVASVPLRTTGTGSKQWPLHLNQQGTDYTVTITGNVDSVGGRGGCAVAGQGGAGAMTTLLALLVLVLGLRRRWAR